MNPPAEPDLDAHSSSHSRILGAISVSAQPHVNEFVKGEYNLTLYQFNISTAKHFFCKTCSIYKHHRRRSNPNQLGIKVACMESVSTFDFPEILMIDGVCHPSVTKSGPSVVGVLCFFAT